VFSGANLRCGRDLLCYTADTLFSEYPPDGGFCRWAIELAAQVSDEQGRLVQGTFISIPNVVCTHKWGGLPVGPLITFKVPQVRTAGSYPSALERGSRLLNSR
jgi:hypothetical protein